MKKSILTVVILLIMTMAVALSGCAQDKEIPKNRQFAYNESEWDTTFYDDFGNNVLDDTKWKVNTMINEENPEYNGIRRAAYYVDEPENLFVKDGNLVIRTNYRTSGLGTGWHTSWLESSVKASTNLQTNPNYTGLSQKNGYFEIRCIAPPSHGIWSAFWMMPDGGKAFTEEDEQWSGKDGIEIDIMESPNYAVNRESVAHVLHADGYSDQLKSVNSGYYKVPNLYTEYHTYALEWTETEYIFYIDGWETWRTEHVVNDKVMGVSEVEQFLILSVEVGGYNDNGTLKPGVEGDGSKSWAGDPNKNDKSKNYDFVVDYVKVLQRK